MQENRKISNSKLDELCRLSHLVLADSERLLIHRSLEFFVGSLTELDSVQTENVIPLTQCHENSLVTREDSPSTNTDLQQLQQLTSHTKNRLYIVPKVFDR